MRTLADIEHDISDAYRLVLEYRGMGEERMAAHHERWMNVKLDELLLRLPVTVGASECAGSPG